MRSLLLLLLTAGFEAGAIVLPREDLDTPVEKFSAFV